MRVIVVGAGLSGLMAAQEIHNAGHEVIVFDKGRGVGGRLATRRIDAATLDHGAQFFTVRTNEFAAHVDKWELHMNGAKVSPAKTVIPAMWVHVECQALQNILQKVSMFA